MFGPGISDRIEGVVDKILIFQRSMKCFLCQKMSNAVTHLDGFRVQSSKANPLNLTDYFLLVLGLTRCFQPHESIEPRPEVVYPKVMHR